MVDMKKTDDEKSEDSFPSPVSCQSDYPYGLCISLCEDELNKLNLTDEDVQPGDMIHLHCMATVTSISNSASTSSEPSCRVELQITHIAAEDEDDEDQASELSMRDVTNKLYNKGRLV